MTSPPSRCPAATSSPRRRPTRCTRPWRRSSAHHRPALLAHELRQVVVPERALARRAARLPAAERLRARPRAGGSTRAPVDVDDAGLDAVEERVDLALV